MKEIKDLEQKIQDTMAQLTGESINLGDVVYCEAVYPGEYDWEPYTVRLLDSIDRVEKIDGIMNISVRSPFGGSILGKRVGDNTKFKVQEGFAEVRINNVVKARDLKNGSAKTLMLTKTNNKNTN